MAAHGQRLNLRLFLEGQEIPCISASVQVQIGSPASASIQVVATDGVLELLPRTLVHLFFYDYMEAGDIGTAPAATSPVFENQAATFVMSERDIRNTKYKLLFMGEVVGVAFQKSASGNRSAVLKCLDMSNYWDTTYTYGKFDITGYAQQTANFIGASYALFSNPIGGSTMQLASVLSGKCRAFPGMEGILAGMINLLERIGGIYYGQQQGFTGVNDFFSVAELRLKLSRMIASAPNDISTVKLFERKTGMQWLMGATQSLGTLVNFRDILRLIGQYVYIEPVPCPAAYLRPPDTVAPVSVPTVRLLTLSQLNPAISNGLNTIMASLGRTLGNLTTSQEVAASINSTVQASRSEIASASTGLGDLSVLARQSDLIQLGSQLIVSEAMLNAVVNAPPDESGRALMEKAIREVLALLNSAITQSTRRSITGAGQSFVQTSRLQNQIIRPDIYFVSPPTCNVVFPENISDITYNRDFLAEPSRMELSLSNWLTGGLGPLLGNSRYYAPNVEGLRDTSLNLDRARLYKIILPHELYTGIVPVFERLPEFSAYAGKSGNPLSVGTQPIPYAQRLVNFNYFRSRFASRQGAFNGRFNPYLIPGCPAVAIDRWISASQLDTIRTKLANLRAQAEAAASLPTTQPILPKLADVIRDEVPAQYVGMIAALAHTVNQGGGRTQCQLSAARTHKESTEFLGADEADKVTTIGTAVVTKIWAYDLANIPIISKPGPAGGTITAFLDVTAAQTGRELVKAFGNQKVKIEIGASGPTFLAFEVTELVPRIIKTRGSLPIEEITRPPWFDPIYTNPRIGEFYRFCYGVGSITDDTTIKINNQLIGNIPSVSAVPPPPAASAAFAAGAAALTGSQTIGAATSQIQAGLDPILQAIQQTDGSIEDSVNLVLQTYSALKAGGLDVNDFVRGATFRRIASLPEILGTLDLSFIPPETSGGLGALAPTRVATGAEGFHSRAFSSVGNLFALVDTQVSTLLGLRPDNLAVATLDPRPGRYEAVRKYRLQLSSVGLLG